jgi:hypothetical protein
MNRTIQLSFTADELRLLADALDSHMYWEISDEGERSQGFHGQPAADSENERTDEYQQFAAISARIEAALRQDVARGQGDP